MGKNSLIVSILVYSVSLEKRIIEEIEKTGVSGEKLNSLKSRLASEFGKNIPSNATLLSMIDKQSSLRQTLQKRKTRSISGVSVIAVMTSPHPCPHGRCVYCPTEAKIPQSYLSREPAVMRAQRAGFDSFAQVQNRVNQYKLTGHNTDKNEIIVMGGTFTARDWEYQKEFVKGCFDGLNGFKSASLDDAKKANEKTASRCVGLTIETKPDWAKKDHIEKILELGATRVELGVQIPDDENYILTKRGHTVQDVVESTQYLKDAGLKVCHHFMPNLPGSTPEKDLRYFRLLFDDQRYRPDMLKIYPTLVATGAELYDWHKDGRYECYDEETLIKLLMEIKASIPEYVRVMRFHRDIPAFHILHGTRKSNLGDIVLQRMEEKGMKCKCIRCREVGHQLRKGREIGDVSLRVIEYDSSLGKEYFINYGNDDVIIGLLRLRIPYEPFISPITSETAIVREVHVFGQEMAIGEKNEANATLPSSQPQNTSWQHKGVGKMMLLKAEEITKDIGMEKVAVTSGVGVREYYRKFGYSLDGFHMVKTLD